MNIPVPSLFIGSLIVPYKLRRGKEESWDEHQTKLKVYGLVDSRISFGYLQTGGVFCNYQDLFGVFFEISGELLSLCVDTCHVAPVSFEILKKYDYELSKFGLFLSGRGCAYLEEAVIAGINPEALLVYIRKRNLKLWDTTQRWIENSFEKLDDIEKTVRTFCLSIEEWMPSLADISLTGAILYKNCD